MIQSLSDRIEQFQQEHDLAWMMLVALVVIVTILTVVFVSMAMVNQHSCDTFLDQNPKTRVRFTNDFDRCWIETPSGIWMPLSALMDGGGKNTILLFPRY